MIDSIIKKCWYDKYRIITELTANKEKLCETYRAEHIAIDENLIECEIL